MHTTLNLKISDIQKINEISHELRIRKEDVVKLIITEIIDQNPLLENFSNSLKYQADDPSYKKLHIEFSQIEYEQNFDLKKIYKFSLSFLVSFGLSLFGDRLSLKKHLPKKLSPSMNYHESAFLDSYHRNSYTYVSLDDENRRILSILWEYQKG